MDSSIDKRIIRTKVMIRNALIALIEEKGFEALSVKDITSKANINRGTFYLHYKDKYDLLEQILTEITQDIVNILNDITHLSPQEFKDSKAPYAIIVRVFEYFSNNCSLVQTVFGTKGNSAIQTKIKKKMWSILFEKNYSTLIRKENLKVPSEYLASYIASAHFGVIQEWLESGRKETPEEMARVLFTLSFHGPLFAAGVF